MRPGMSATVSVIVPTYQRRDYLLRAVASILAQTYERFELIVVDDGSTDGTDQALRDLDRRLRYHWQENRGPAAARNAGIAMARGEIVAFLDSDNRWRPHHLALLTDALARFPQAVLATSCPSFQIAGRTPAARAELVDALPSLLLRNVVGYTSCTAIRADALRAAGGFDEQLPVFEDTDLWLRLAMQGPFCMVPHRTIVHQSTRGGLKQRGVRAGRYLPAVVLSTRRAEERLRCMDRADRDDLIARARARVLLVEAVRGLSTGDHEATRRALVEACALAPELSSTPEIVLGQLRLAPVEDTEASRLINAAGRLWPAQDSDTARYLHGYGAVRTLRAGHVTEAGRQLWPARTWLDPRFLARTTPISFRLVRGWLQQRRGHGDETVPPHDSPGSGPSSLRDMK